MADNPIESARPVSGMGHAFARHQDVPGGAPTAHHDETARPQDDRAEVRRGRELALDLLRHRVLAHTRQQLELAPNAPVPEFAEVADGEPIPAFLGRLLSAQNQLAACCHGRFPAAELRRRLDGALQQGADETIDVLVENGTADAVAVVVDVLAEYGRRLAALSDDAG